MTRETLTLSLKQNPELSSQTTQLVALAEFFQVETPEESVEASEFLARIQRLRRWIDGIYKDVKAPLATARRTLDAQQKALLDPLAIAERDVMNRIVAFRLSQDIIRKRRETEARLEATNIAQAEQTQQAERIRLVAENKTTPEAAAVALHDQADMIENAAPLVMPAPVVMDSTLADGMQSRTTYTAKVENLRDLVMGVAAQIMISEYEITEDTRAFLTKTFLPTPQCSLSLVDAVIPQLNALARALRHDLNIPGVTLEKNTTLVTTKVV